MLIATVAALGLGLLPMKAFPSPPAEMKQLRKSHGKQRKTLKQQQRAARNIMKQHEVDRESTERFRHNMQMQRQLLKKNQHVEARRLKQRNKAGSHVQRQNES